MSRKKLFIIGTLAILTVLTLALGAHSALSGYSGMFMD